MEGEQSTSLVLSEDPSTQEEVECNFRRLYDQVLDSFQEGTENFEARINGAITDIIRSWDSGNRLERVDLNDWYTAAGYVYRYDPHGAGLVRCRVLEVLQNCTAFQSILDEKKLVVISLAGGPANDAIGFCSALSRFKYAGELKIHIVGATSKWKSFIDMAEVLLKRGGFGDASDLFQRGKVQSLYFIEGELPSFLRDKVLLGYDVVLICKLMNHLSLYEMDTLIQYLHEKLNESAFILLIDTQIIHQKWSEFFDFLYLSDECQHYYSGTDVAKFGHHDHIKSRARIAVLRKRKIANEEKNPRSAPA